MVQGQRYMFGNLTSCLGWAMGSLSHKKTGLDMGLKMCQLEEVVWWPASLMTGLSGLAHGGVKNTNLCLVLPMSGMGAERTC